MTDIVERLRQVQGDNKDARKAADLLEWMRDAYEVASTRLAAAISINKRLVDEIERMQIEVERLRANEEAAIFSFRETNDMALEEIKRLRAELEESKK